MARYIVSALGATRPTDQVGLIRISVSRDDTGEPVTGVPLDVEVWFRDTKVAAAFYKEKPPGFYEYTLEWNDGAVWRATGIHPLAVIVAQKASRFWQNPWFGWHGDQGQT